MLEFGMDSHTLELHLSNKSDSVSENMSDFIKAITYAFRLANAN